MDIRYLEQDEKEKSRRLYEVSFPEDSEEFVEYYYTEKCRDNEILVMEDFEQVISMIHLNPFTVSLYGQDASVHYVVAVATHEEYRMQGYMRQLMERAFADMYDRGEIFTFLTPASPDYYYSCGYEYWENQIHLDQDQDTIWTGNQRILCAVDGDCQQMAEFSNETLKNQFDLYVKKDQAYYQRLIKEQECDGGHLIVIKEMTDQGQTDHARSTSDTRVSGIFCLNRGMGMYVREPIFAHSCSEDVQAKMMGRIIHLERFCQMQKSTEPVELKVRVRDTMIPENEGCFAIRIDDKGGEIQRLVDQEMEQSMDIAELGQLLFDRMRIYINEVV